MTSSCDDESYCHVVSLCHPIMSHTIHRLNVCNMDTNPHDDVIKWQHFLHYWPFVREIHRSPVNSHHKGLWLGALMLSLIYAWTNGWANNREAGDLRRHRAHFDVTVMLLFYLVYIPHQLAGRHDEFVRALHTYMTIRKLQKIKVQKNRIQWGLGPLLHFSFLRFTNSHWLQSRNG